MCVSECVYVFMCKRMNVSVRVCMCVEKEMGGGGVKTVFRLFSTFVHLSASFLVTPVYRPSCGFHS